MDDRQDDVLRDRYRGCLLGLAVGDALGAPLEFLSRTDIAQRHGEVREMLGGGWLQTEPGEYTDDTQMALAIARSAVEHGEIDPADIALRFLEWYHSLPKDIGNTTVMSLQHLASGIPWHEAGEKTLRLKGDRAAANGSLMRAAPIALASRNDRDALIRNSIDISRITHADPRACWSCVALNQAIAALLTGDGDAIQEAAIVNHAEVARVVIQQSTATREEVRAGGYVLETLGAAFWAFRNHDGFEDVVVAAVNLGDDADTAGAVAGALAGARYGASAIPGRWLDVLQGRDELITLADGLLELS